MTEKVEISIAELNQIKARIGELESQQARLFGRIDRLERQAQHSAQHQNTIVRQIEHQFGLRRPLVR